MDHVILDLFMKPCNIFWIGQLVLGTVKDGNREANVFQVVLWWRGLIVPHHVAIMSVIKALELECF